MISADEKERMNQIRNNLARLKSKGYAVEVYEAYFLLGIIDRLLKHSDQ